MSDCSNFPALTNPAEDPKSALSTLYKFRAQNPLKVPEAPMFSPSPPPSPCPTLGPPSPRSVASSALSQSPTAPNYPNFDSSRMAIPSAAYTQPYHPPRASPSSLHVPKVYLRPPPQSPILFTPQSITQEMVMSRVHMLLSTTLPEWWAKNPDALFHLARRMANSIIFKGQAGGFGPEGLGKVSDIFICIGHERTKHYMCLATGALWGDVVVFLKGELCERKGKDAMHDARLMEMCKAGFDREAARVYQGIVTEAGKPGSAKRR